MSSRNTPPDAPPADAPPADAPPAVLDGVTGDAPPASPEVSLCNFPVVKKNKNGEPQKYTADDIAKLPAAEREGKNVGDDITAPCIKAKGHEVKTVNGVTTGHSWRAYTKIDTSVVTLDDINSFALVTDDDGDMLETREQEDSEVQKGINEQVVAGYRKWVAAGKPKTWENARKAGVILKYRVTPTTAPAYRSMLKVAASRTKDRTDLPFVSVKVHPKLHKHVSGFDMLWFYVVEHNSRNSDESTEAAQTGGSAS